MKVVSYYNGIPTKNKSQEKFDILIKFIQGVNAAGDQGIVHQGFDIIPADVGVIQGWQHETGKTAPHLVLRQKVIDTIQQGKKVVSADANLFLYATEKNKPHHYLRYSFNGIFPNTGIYCDTSPNPKRWEQISKDLDIKLEDDKRNGRHILVCVQRAGGWSMGKKDLGEWCVETVNAIRQHSDRPIVLRLHPGDKKTLTKVPPAILALTRNPGISLSDASTRHINQDLENCWAVVNHNSSSIVAPLIQGYPAFITDPVKSQCAEVSHMRFSKIETPDTFDRLKWLERISMFHWKFDELVNGDCWRHMRSFING